MVWAGTKDGEFTVCSAYHMANEGSIRDEGSCSNTQQLRMLWKGIWSIKGARVVKTFMWQACNDILPTKERLCKRHITPDPLCPICRLETETLEHILWRCQLAKDVWIECSPQIHKCTSDEVEFILVLEKLLARLDEDQMHLVATVATQIWLRRNAVIFRGDFLDPSSLMRMAKAQVDACSEDEQCQSTREVAPKAPVNVG